MTADKKCPKCQCLMETGYIPDFAYGAIYQTRWHRGPPQLQSFLGMPLKSLNVKSFAGYPLEAWRCPGCTLVEFYAPNETQS